MLINFYIYSDNTIRVRMNAGKIMHQLCLRNILPGFLLLTFLLMPLPSVCAAEPGDKPSHGLNNLSIEQLMDIEIDTVYGASRYEQKVTEAPSSVSIVTGAEIK